MGDGRAISEREHKLSEAKSVLVKRNAVVRLLP